MRASAVIASFLVVFCCEAGSSRPHAERLLLVSPTGWRLTVFPHGSAVLARDHDLAASQMIREGMFRYDELYREVKKLMEAGPPLTEVPQPNGDVLLSFNSEKLYKVSITSIDMVIFFPVAETPTLRRTFEYAAELVRSANARDFAEMIEKFPLVPPKKEIHSP